MRRISTEAIVSLGIPFQREGNHFVHCTKGRFAPLINVIVTIEEDLSGATVMAALAEPIPKERRVETYELLNLAHGQSLWNVRFHLDDDGQLFTVGRVLTWGRPFNEMQFGDIFFSLVVTLDRLYPCLVPLLEGRETARQAFEHFFSKGPGSAN